LPFQEKILAPNLCNKFFILLRFNGYNKKGRANTPLFYHKNNTLKKRKIWTCLHTFREEPANSKLDKPFTPIHILFQFIATNMDKALL